MVWKNIEERSTVVHVENFWEQMILQGVGDNYMCRASPLLSRYRQENGSNV